MTGSNLQTDDPLAKRPAENQRRDPWNGMNRPSRSREGHRRPDLRLNCPIHGQINAVIVYSF